MSDIIAAEEVEPVVSYRKAKPTDAVAIFALLRRMHAESAADLAPIDEGKAIMVILQTIREGLSLVAIFDKKIVGAIAVLNQEPWWSLEREPADLWYYALPEHRSRGVGIAMLRQVVSVYPKGRLRLSDVAAGAELDERLAALYERVAGLKRVGSIYMRGR